MAAIRRSLPRGPIEWKRVPHHLLAETRKDVLIRFVMLFVCLSAMFMTGSRGGVLVSLAVMILTFMIYFGRDLSWKGMAISLAACVATGLALLQILGGNIGGRIDIQGLSDAGRLSAYRSTLKIIADNPWFGTGLGTFASGFPAYRRDDISMQCIWDIGHNTHLEFASEMGIPLTLVVATGVGCGSCHLVFWIARAATQYDCAAVVSRGFAHRARAFVDRFLLADRGLFDRRVRAARLGAFASHRGYEGNDFARQPGLG